MVIFGIPAAIQQHRYWPIQKDSTHDIRVDWSRLAIVGLILAAAIAANVVVNTRFSAAADRFPFIGAAARAAARGS